MYTKRMERPAVKPDYCLLITSLLMRSSLIGRLTRSLLHLSVFWLDLPWPPSRFGLVISQLTSEP